ncbi:MAG: YdcF family protein [Polyangia bacterium]
MIALAAGCAVGHLEQHGAPTQPFDMVIVPGCPSQDDGRLSRCQVARALWAAVLWERGWAKGFITSGSDVHTPYVEAEAIAQVMTALGVPADRIWLEGDALHTDENMFYSLRIARSLGARTIGVASTRGHSLWACRMMIDWGQDCRSISLDLDAVKKRRVLASDLGLESLRAHATPAGTWMELRERERAVAKRVGRTRPPSWMLYPMIAVMRATGTPWVPIPPPGDPKLETWAKRSAELAELAASARPAASP